MERVDLPLPSLVALIAGAVRTALLANGMVVALALLLLVCLLEGVAQSASASAASLMVYPIPMLSYKPRIAREAFTHDGI